MDIHHMTFADGCDMCTVLITFLVVVLIDHGDNLLRREVVDVGMASHIQCAGLHG